MDELNEDQIIELGGFCEALRLHPSFNALIKTFERQIIEHMMSTEPHEKNKREGIFASVLGLRDFQAHMNACVEQKDKLIEAFNKKPALSEYDAQAEDHDDDDEGID